MRSIAVPSRMGFWVGVIALAGLVGIGVSLGTESMAGQEIPTRTLGPNAGIVISNIQPDRTADFEMVMARVKEALQSSEIPLRQQQARSWKVFRAAEQGPGGAVIYLHVVDPAVADADYTVSRILSEGFPAEAQELYNTYSESFSGGLTYLNLSLVEDFGQ